MSVLTRPDYAEMLGAQLPRLSQQPSRAVASAGDDCIAWAESIGWDDDDGHGFYVLDDWQKWCIRGILSEDRRANLCALVCLLLVPRQNGKNVVLEVVELYALFVLDLRYILHSAHLTETSADHMSRLWEAIQSDEDLAIRSKQTTAHGFEKIERIDLVPDEKGHRHRGRIRFRTRSKKVGRGGSPQMAVFDEALYLTDLHLSALLPSLSAQTMRADPPILIYASSAPVGESQVLHRVRSSILAGELPDAWMAEWSVDTPPADEARYQALLDACTPANVLAANPGGNVRISVDYVLDTERPQMGLEEWCTERLGMVFTADGESGVLPAVKWDACGDDLSDADTGRASLSVGRGGRSASFGFAGMRADGLLHVEVARHEPGTAWVIAHAKAVTAVRGSLLIDPKGASAGMFAKLKAAGVEMEEVSGPDMVRACSALQDDVLNRALRHLDQPELNAAVAGADVRTIGQGWVFDAKAASVDICPLEAVVLAASGARSTKRKSAAPRRIR